MNRTIETNTDLLTTEAESFIRAMMEAYQLQREDILLGIQQFGMIKSRIRNYCKIAAGLKSRASSK
jgi:hypothetical protein